jgi:predicted nucleic acid-binding protein
VTFGLDTSVVLRLLVGAPVAQAEAARRLLQTAAEPVLISDLVVGESYFALRHHYAAPHGAAVTALRALLDDPRVRAPGAARKVLQHAGSETPGLMDRLIHEHYRGDGAALATFDRDAAKLKGAHLVE